MSLLHEEKELIQGIFSILTPMTVQYDKQVHLVQVAQQQLGKKLDQLAHDLESMIKEGETSYETKGHLARIVATRKKLVAVYNNLVTIDERLTKIQKTIQTKYPTMPQMFDTFNVPLSEIMARSRETEKVPRHMLKLAKRIREIGLDKEGIFRLSALAYDVRDLQQRYDEGEDVDLDNVENVILLAQLYKSYLRELPAPLCTDELYEQFLATSALSTDQEKLEKLKALLKKIPSENYELIKLSFELALDTSKESAKNKMGPHNLAVVFGMNIFSHKAHDGARAMKDNPAIIKTSQWMIEHFGSLFLGAPLEVPEKKVEKVDEQSDNQQILEELKEPEPLFKPMEEFSKLETQNDVPVEPTLEPTPPENEIPKNEEILGDHTPPNQEEVEN